MRVVKWMSWMAVLALGLINVACEDHRTDYYPGGSYWIDWRGLSRPDFGKFDGAQGVVDGAQGLVDGAQGLVDGAQGLVDGAQPAEPVCNAFTTQQGAVCVSCERHTGATPVVSCTSEAPPKPSTCHTVKLAWHTCKVCHDRSGAIVSSSCVQENACKVTRLAGESCLVCTVAGKQTFKECHPARQSCTTVSSGSEICIVCTDGNNKMLSKDCKPQGQSCNAEQVAGKTCLMCRDSSGTPVTTVCKPQPEPT